MHGTQRPAAAMSGPAARGDWREFESELESASEIRSVRSTQELWQQVGFWLFESSPDCVKLLDLDGRLLRMNASGKSLMELGDEVQVLGLHWARFWPDETRALVESAIDAARQGGVGEFQERCLTRTGQPKWWDSRITPIRQEGRITHLLAVSRDVTRLMEACAAALRAEQSAETATQAKARFVTNVSHEVRTPLNAITGLSQLLLNTQPTPEQRTHLEKIEASSSHLALLMEDVVDVSDMELGALKLHQGEFELSTALGRAIGAIRQMAVSSGLALSFSVSPEVPQRLVGDATRLKQLLLNCATSAAKLKGAGRHIDIRVRVASRSPGAVVLVFDITRSGVQMSPAQIDEALERTPADAARPEQRGIGFGIAVSRRIAELMGGGLDIQSDAAAGSTFWFSALLEEASAPQVRKSSHAGPAPELAGKRVLVVEDDPLAREVTGALLQAAQVLVQTADHGAEALEALRHQSFDAVLMDMNMPVMGGAEATRRIRGELRLVRLPVIALTGNVHERDRAECLAAGASDFLGKPIDAAKLWAALARWIRAPN